MTFVPVFAGRVLMSCRLDPGAAALEKVSAVAPHGAASLCRRGRSTSAWIASRAMRRHAETTGPGLLFWMGMVTPGRVTQPKAEGKTDG